MASSRPPILSVLLLCLFIVTETLSTNKRNVLILLADDGGFELGVYNNKICQTPNIDELARRSVLFNNAFNSVSSCSPSRAALLTGVPSHENGQYGLHHGVHHFNSFDNVTSLPNILRDHNILTGIIGKKHVGPANVYRFDVEHTEEHNDINQVGRNITRMKLLARDFLRRANQEDRSFLLYIGFHDPHRCHEPGLGAFCERFGSGLPGTGRVPDWTPWYYQWDEVQVPYHVQDTEPARRDIAAQYTTMSRLDQGVGVMLRELAAAGRERDTLVVFTSDNGIPFPGGRTNLYDAGLRAPLLLAAPGVRARVSQALVSQLQLAPALLRWLRVPPPASLASLAPPSGNDVCAESAQSPPPRDLLDLLEEEPTPAQRETEDEAADAAEDEAVFASQTHHEVTMYYPMRAVRTRRYKLIHNLNFGMPFPIDQDLYSSATFQDLLNRTRAKQPLAWYKTLREYYFRPQWELYDLRQDPAETRNLHDEPSLRAVEAGLRARLRAWQRRTRDPWLCAPSALLDRDAVCRDLDNGLLSYINL